MRRMKLSLFVAGSSGAHAQEQSTAAEELKEEQTQETIPVCRQLIEALQPSVRTVGRLTLRSLRQGNTPVLSWQTAGKVETEIREEFCWLDKGACFRIPAVGC